MAGGAGRCKENFCRSDCCHCSRAGASEGDMWEVPEGEEELAVAAGELAV
jgi:hypothetical protein